MTAIAYRDGIMAADTLTTGGGYIRGHATKLARSPKGTIAGCAGQAGTNSLFRHMVRSGAIDTWLDDGCARPLDLGAVEQGSFGAIIVQADGTVTCVDYNGLAGEKVVAFPVKAAPPAGLPGAIDTVMGAMHIDNVDRAYAVLSSLSTALTLASGLLNKTHYADEQLVDGVNQILIATLAVLTG